MGQMVGTVILAGAAVFFLGTSVAAFVSPAMFGARLGFTMAGADGLNEVRAQYGGFFLAAAIVSVAGLTGAVPRSGALLVMAVVFGGLIFGRLVSLALDRGFTGYGATIRALFAIDTVGLVAALVALGLAARA